MMMLAVDTTTYVWQKSAINVAEHHGREDVSISHPSSSIRSPSVI